MKTVITNLPLEAADFIKRGGIVAFPTETVYGLGANVFDEVAIGKIFEAKRRPADNPLIAHIAEVKQLKLLSVEITEIADKFIASFFPGPLTVVLRKSTKVPLIATAGLDTIGVRMPRTELAHQFLSACGTPVVAPSANISGRPSPTTWQAVVEDLNGRIDCILQGDPTEIGLESTVVDCTSDKPALLRPGAISIDQLRAVVPTTLMFRGDESDIAKSPGMRHRHYSPKGDVIIVNVLITSQKFVDAAYIGMDKGIIKEHFDVVRLCDTVEEYAHTLFDFFRECDRNGIEDIYCGEVPEAGIGTALMDRLRRAAEV